MQKVERRKKEFRIKFFENNESEFKDFIKAKEMLNDGKDIIAVGYVNINGREMLVRTSKIKEIMKHGNTVKLFTNSMEYSVEV